MQETDKNLIICLKRIGFELLEPLRFKKDNLMVSYDNASSIQKEVTIKAINAHQRCALVSKTKTLLNPLCWFK